MIRNYRADDFQEVIVLYKNTDFFGGRHDPSRDTPERLLATAEAGDLLVCEIDDSILGTVMILNNPHSCWLLRFCVNSASANAKQVAIELDDAARKIARERGHSDVIVYADPDNTQLVERYRNLGYKEANNYQAFWRPA